MLDLMSEPHLFVPVSEITARLRALGAAEARIAAFLDRCADVAAGTPKFICGPFGQEPRSLRDLPATPPQEALTEFFVVLQWDLAWELCTDGETPAVDKMQAWRNGRRPAVQDLERQLGCQLYHYAADGDELDDDYAHRNLCLDYFCHMLPDSPFVAFLIEGTGARDLAELRAALLSPEAYTVPFALYYLGSIEATVAEPFVWVPPIAPDRVLGIAAGGPRAASVAAGLLFPLEGGRVVIACPDEKVYHRISSVAREGGMEVWGEPSLNDQLPFLARIDVLYIVADWADGPRWDRDAKHERSLLRLAALAESVGVPMTWFDAFGRTPPTLQGQIEASGVLKDIANGREEARAATRTVKRIRLLPDWESSGIEVVEDAAGCDGEGVMGYDELDVPFALIRDLVRWHDRFNVRPTHAERPEGFWEAFKEEQKALVIRLADALRPGVQVE